MPLHKAEENGSFDCAYGSAQDDKRVGLDTRSRTMCALKQTPVIPSGAKREQ